MNSLYHNKEYMEDVKLVALSPLPWNKIEEKSILLSGATGLIGSFLIDVLLYRKEYCDQRCHIYALGRNETKTAERFGERMNDFTFIQYDVNRPLIVKNIKKIDFILHLASNTHPVAYATDPIGTITTNISGTANMLDFAVEHHAERCAFASSNEIYGENRGDVELFDEQYCGYIDCNTMRAGYPESKRCGEALCQAYIKQRGLDIVIPRLTRSYGPTMQLSDSKAISQFIKKAINGEDIILKSTGTQFFSYTYVADAVSGLLTVLLCGKNGEAYNIADDASDIMLKDLAEIIADYIGKKVAFEIPDATEHSGYSKVTKARLDSSKLKALCWHSHYDIQSGIRRTIRILKDIH